MPDLHQTDIDQDSYEIVPIPTDQARVHDPIALSFVSDYWNDNRLVLRLFWNPGMGQYIMQLETARDEGLGTLLSWTPIELHRPYQYRDWLRLIFIDETDSHDRIRPARLGDSIQCTIWPGPNNPEFEAYEPETGSRWDLEVTTEPWMPLLGYDPGAVILT